MQLMAIFLLLFSPFFLCFRSFFHFKRCALDVTASFSLLVGLFDQIWCAFFRTRISCRWLFYLLNSYRFSNRKLCSFPKWEMMCKAIDFRANCLWVIFIDDCVSQRVFQMRFFFHKGENKLFIINFFLVILDTGLTLTWHLSYILLRLSSKICHTLVC